MLKELVRTAVAEGARLSSVLSVAEAGLRDRLTILCYHRVLSVADKSRYFIPDLVVTPEAFRTHCDTISQHFDVRTLRDAFAAFREGRVGKRPLLAITFDDGYVDNHELAAPILAQFGLPATFFVIADLVGSEGAPWYDRVGRAVKQLEMQGRGVSARGEVKDSAKDSASGHDVARFAKTLSPSARAELVTALEKAAGVTAMGPLDRIMTFDELKSLIARGHEVGSHSCSHEILPSLDDQALAHEVRDSREALERGLGQAVTSLCYPNGDYDARTTRLAAEFGYQCAVTTKRGANAHGERPFELKRWFIHEGRLARPDGLPSGAQLRLELTGLSDLLFRRKSESSVKT